MMPFSGFMQTLAGQQPFGGQKTTGFASPGPERAGASQGILPLDGDSHSFLEWVGKLTASDLNAAMEHGDAAGAIRDDVAADGSAMEALQALLGEAMGHHQPDPPAVQVPMADSGSDAPASVDPEIPHALTAGQADGGCPPRHTHVHQVLAAVQQMIMARRQGEPGSLGPALVAQTDRPAVTMPDNGPAARSETGTKLDSTNLAMPSPAVIAGKSPAASKPMARTAPAGDMTAGHAASQALKAETARLAETEATVIAQQPGKRPAAETAAPKTDGPTLFKDAVATTAGLTDQRSDASTDDPTASRSAGNAIAGLSAEAEDSQEVMETKGQPSDPVRPIPAEQAKSTDSFQAAVKQVATDKPAAPSAAPITRTDESAVKGFQNTVMEQIVEKASVRTIQGRSAISIRLKPEFLGNVQMHVATDKAQLVVRVVTDQPVVKEIIEANLHQLKAELHHQGLTIDRFDVMVNPDADHQHQRESFAQMFKQSPTPNNRKDSREQDPETMHRRGGNQARSNQSDGDGVNYFA